VNEAKRGGAGLLDPVSARWAGALFNLARRQGALEPVRRDLERVAAELAVPRVRAFVLGKSSPERAEKLASLLASFHPLTRNFVRLALDRGRGPVLLHAAEAFRRRALAEEGVLEGVVESARALDSSELSALEGTLGARLGARVRLSQRTREELLAGVRVFVGARLMDQSVQGRLEALRRRLEGARVSAGA